jgi:adenine-specific DNA-methyltransferase
MLLEHTKEFLENSSLDDRKKKGQYFTKKSLKDASLKNIIISDGMYILENSCGTGEFIHSILEKNPNVDVDAYDIDEALIDLVKENYVTVNAYCSDWLLDTSDKKYDKIIGNPPYFEISKAECKERGYGEFLKFCKSKPNIYAFFIAKSIQHLKEEGELIYVVPTSMNNGYGFSLLRNFIIENCNIKNIILHSDDDFKDAQQNTMTLHLQKLKEGQPNDGKYIYTNKTTTIFSKNTKAIEDLFKNKKSLKELGFDVYTGNYVWNQNKKFMSAYDHDTLLLWASNIEKNSLKLNPTTSNGQMKFGLTIGPIPLDYKKSSKEQKSQWVSEHSENRDPIDKKSIIVNRVTGCGTKAGIRAAIIDIDRPYYTENHLNYIIETENSVMTLEELHRKLISPETTKILEYISGNTQLSKKELLNLIPIFLENKEEKC